MSLNLPTLLLFQRIVVFLDQNSPWIKEGSESYHIEDAGIGTFLVDFAQNVLKAAGENELKVESLGQTKDEGLSGEKVIINNACTLKMD